MPTTTVASFSLTRKGVFAVVFVTANGGTQSPGCRICEIAVSLVARIGETTDGFNSLPIGVVAGAREYLVVFGRSRVQQPVLVMKDGGASRELGRSGAGPREHAGISAVSSGPGDSIVVLRSR
jgi:hypothetical protein